MSLIIKRKDRLNETRSTDAWRSINRHLLLTRSRPASRLRVAQASGQSEANYEPNNNLPHYPAMSNFFRINVAAYKSLSAAWQSVPLAASVASSFVILSPRLPISLSSIYTETVHFFRAQFLTLPSSSHKMPSTFIRESGSAAWPCFPNLALAPPRSRAYRERNFYYIRRTSLRGKGREIA